MAVIGEAHIVIRAITDGFEKDAKKAIKSINSSGGGSGGNAFSKLGNDADNARLKFNKLTKAGYALAPAIAGTVGAVGDLAMGLFAVGSAVGAAAPALAVLPGLLTAVAQAGIAAKLAFGGVGKAVSALLKQKTAGGGGTNDNAVADARKRLAKAYQTAADQMAAANDKVRKAQEKLNQAYKEGTESLQQLGFDAEEAAIAQSKAAIELERAQETLARVQDLSPNNRARRDAELAFREADLSYRKATDNVNDLAVQQEYAAETGLDGTREVIDATNDLAEAEADRAKAIRDTTQDIQEAQEALTRVLNSGGSSSSSDALAGLSEEAKVFAQFIADLQPKIQELRAAAGRMLFPLLQTSIQTLVDDLFPRLIPKLELTGRALGKVAEDFANTITSADNLKRIDSILGNNVGVVSSLGGAAVNLAEAFIIIVDAAGPLITKFSEWVELTTAGWTETLKAKDATGELTEIFNNSGSAAATIGGALGSAGGAFFELGKSAKDAGLKIIKAFDGAMDKLKDFAVVAGNDGMFSEGARGASTLETKFDKIADNFITIGKFAGELVEALFTVSGNPGIKTFFESIMGLPSTFADLANKINSVMGEKFGAFVSEFGTLIANFTDTGGMSIFFDILTTALKVVNTLFSNPVIAAAFGFLAAIKGITLAFGVLGVVGSFAGNVIFSSLMFLPKLINGQIKPLGGLTKMYAALRQEVVMLTYTLGIGLGPILAIVAAIAAIVAIFYLAYQNSEILRTAVKNLVDAVGGALNDAMTTINTAIQKVMPSFTGVSAIFKKIGDYIGTYLVPFFQIILVGAINIIAAVIAGFITVLGGIFKAFSVPIEAIKFIINAFIDFVGGLKDKITEKTKGMWDGIKDAFKAVIDFIINAWNSLSFIIPGVQAGEISAPAAKAVAKKTASVKAPAAKAVAKKVVPKGARLAEGGIVPATRGGMLSIIGEAGRPERVEPLDRQGLSTRDRAIISQLSGGGTNGVSPVFNIYPSEGMDERALASVVSRNLVWSMRRGA